MLQIGGLAGEINSQISSFEVAHQNHIAYFGAERQVQQRVIEPIDRLLLYSSITVSGWQSDAPHEVREARI
jgi:hypothetical protein